MAGKGSGGSWHGRDRIEEGTTCVHQSSVPSNHFQGIAPPGHACPLTSSICCSASNHFFFKCICFKERLEITM